MIYAADYVVTQDDARTVYSRGALCVVGSEIVDIGELAAVRERHPEASFWDLGEAVILPGFVNGHTHIPMSALRGYSDDKALMDWLQQDIFPVEARLTPDIVRTASLFSCAELIRTGCTAIYDMYMLEDAVFAAVDQAGMRAVLGESLTQYYPALSAKTEAEHFDRIRRYAREWAGHPLIRGAVTPHAIYTTHADFLKRCRALADETGFLFGLHLAETRGETTDCLAQHGVRPVAYCDALGLLRKDTSVFHMVDVNDEDLDCIQKCGTAIVHNPASNMKLASGIAPLGKILEKGIPLGLGTDGPASNNAQNLFRDLYLSNLLQKLSTGDPRVMSAQTSLDCATRGGAAVLHEPRVGSLEIGKQADFIALDLTQPNLQPVHEIISNIVYAATGLENRLTVVAGRELYRDGEYCTIDYARLRHDMRALRAWAHGV